MGLLNLIGQKLHRDHGSGRSESEHDDGNASFDVWRKKSLDCITKARTMLDRWRSELNASVNAGRSEASHVSEETQRKICRQTRMVISAGEALYALVEIFERQSRGEKAPVGCRWDKATAVEVDRLLDASVTLTVIAPLHNNCADRLEHARNSWHLWCPEYASKRSATVA